jgi:hypothetical protein
VGASAVVEDVGVIGAEGVGAVERTDGLVGIADAELDDTEPGEGVDIFRLETDLLFEGGDSGLVLIELVLGDAEEHVGAGDGGFEGHGTLEVFGGFFWLALAQECHAEAEPAVGEAGIGGGDAAEVALGEIGVALAHLECALLEELSGTGCSGKFLGEEGTGGKKRKQREGNARKAHRESHPVAGRGGRLVGYD